MLLWRSEVRWIYRWKNSNRSRGHGRPLPRWYALFRFHISAQLTLLVALGIADEVEQLGLKGSKKRKGKKLDEDFVVCFYPPCWVDYRAHGAFIAGPQAFDVEGRAKGCAGHATDPEPQGTAEAVNPCQSMFCQYLAVKAPYSHRTSSRKTRRLCARSCDCVDSAS